MDDGLRVRWLDIWLRFEGDGWWLACEMAGHMV
jgi:hypothetical protein